MCVSDGVPLQLNDAFCSSLKGLPNDVFRSGGQHFPFGLALVIFPKWTYFDNYLRALITTLLRQWTRPRSPLVKRECCASNDNSLKWQKLLTWTWPTWWVLATELHLYNYASFLCVYIGVVQPGQPVPCHQQSCWGSQHLHTHCQKQNVQHWR